VVNDLALISPVLSWWIKNKNRDSEFTNSRAHQSSDESARNRLTRDSRPHPRHSPWGSKGA
jgi:hypothetical protein